MKVYLRHGCFVFFATVFSLLFTTCDAKKNFLKENTHWFSSYSFFDEEEYYSFFRDKFAHSFPKELTNFEKDHIEYYAHKEFKPFWTEHGYNEDFIDSILRFFLESRYHGLSSHHFYADTIQSIVRELKGQNIKSSDELYSFLVQLEWLLSEAYLKYANALNFGFTDPKEMNGGKWFYSTLKPDSAMIRDVLTKQTERLFIYLDSIQPRSPEYLVLQEELKKMVSLKDTIFEPIPLIEVDSGKTSQVIPVLIGRLRLTEHFPAMYVSSDIFDEILISVVNRFRENNAIPISNQLDEETIQALNRPIQYYVDRISANLERHRWKVLPGKKSDYIAVNIADFTLRAYMGDTVMTTMKICCGRTEPGQNSVKARTSKGVVQSAYWESPMLYGEINQLVLNPQWHVPERITKEEYYHKLVKNPSGFLQKEKMLLVDVKTNRPVIPDSVDWTKVNKNNIPYRLVQKSGRFNALGIVKFDFPNSESVYLHDTPNKSGFLRRNRAITHGCIRLEKPLDLVEFIFIHNDFTEKEIEKARIDLGAVPKSDFGKKYVEEKNKSEQRYYETLSDHNKLFYRKLRPQLFALKKKMPVFIEYYTCFVGDGGAIQYRNDVYYKDIAILNKIN